MRHVALGLALAVGLVAPALAGQPASFNIFFDRNSTRLTDDGSQIVSSAAQAVRRGHASRIIISAGDPRFAAARFHAVQTALVADGVESGRIARANLAAVPITYNSVAANRVQIMLEGDRSFETAMVPSY